MKLKYSLYIFILYYSNIVNIGNYSFLMYDFTGGTSSNFIFDSLRYIRLPILLLITITILATLNRHKKLASFYLKNWDVIIFIIVSYFGLMNSIDLVNGIFYTVWNTAALIFIIAFFHHLKSNYSFKEGLSILFKILFWSNFIVLPFLFLNLPYIGSTWEYNMAFGSSTFYPYSLLSMIMALYAHQLFLHRSLLHIKYNKLIENFTVFSILFFCFMSGRRTPFILMTIMAVLYLFHGIKRNAILGLMTIALIVIVAAYILPSAINYSENNQDGFFMFKKINDLQQTDGNLSNDGSYSVREYIWQMYDAVISENPATGTGAFNSVVHHNAIFINQPFAGSSPHNLYIGLIVEHGYLGFFSFMILLLRSCLIWIKLNSSYNSFVYFFFLLLPTLVINWNEYNLLVGQIFYWTTMLIILLPRMVMKA